MANLGVLGTVSNDLMLALVTVARCRKGTQRRRWHRQRNDFDSEGDLVAVLATCRRGMTKTTGDKRRKAHLAV